MDKQDSNDVDADSNTHEVPSAAKKKLQHAVKKITAFGGPVRLDDEMNYKDLRTLEKIFNDASGETGLSIEQFRVAMKRTMGSHINDSDLDMIFMKVDTNCDGTVDWDEYLSYMLLEYQEKENMIVFNNDYPFPYPMIEKHSNHLESICRITMLQAYTIRNDKVELDDSASRYITLSKEGVLNAWNTDWVHQKSTLLDGIRNNPRSVWFTDIVCMTNCNTVGVASTDFEISFYSMASNMFQKKFQIKELDYCALTLDFHFEFSDPRRSILLWGDSNGNVVVLRFYDNPSLVLFSSTSSSCVDNKISLSNLVKGHIHNLRVARFANVHTDWIKELRYYVTVKGQECFISCCSKNQNSMLYADITEKLVGNPKKKIEISRKSYFNVKSGMKCISYDTEWNLIITGNRDFTVRVWNPYVVATSTMILRGHSSPVVQVYVRMSDHHIISVSKGKSIRIWDLQDYVLKQAIHGRNVNLGRLEVSALFYNERRMELILGSNIIGIFRPSFSSLCQVMKRKDVLSHHKSVSRVLYNPLFKQLVTGSDDSMVSVWDLKTGSKTMQFCTDIGVEISAMAFDHTFRRLITASRNGAISIWNFNNGARLRALKKSDDLEVSEVVYAKHRILAAGWNKNVTVYHDSYVDESYRRMRVRHNDDILSMDYHKRENILATSSYDGYIFIWSLDVERVLLKFNINISILPIQERQKTTKDRGQSSTTTETVDNFVWLPECLPWANPKQDSDEDDSIESEEDDEEFWQQPSEKAVNKILFLQSRKNTLNTAVLLAATAMGYIAAWSVQQRGGLLGYFSAVKHKGEMIVSMETDPENTVLITGDSRGYIRMWKCDDYCNGTDVVKQRQSVHIEDVDNLFEGVDTKLAEAYRLQHSYIPMDTPPELTTSFRGHLKAVTAISYIKEVELVASGSNDCCVRLWTISGRYIGTFGQAMSWNLQFPIKASELPVDMPDDVRRIASPRTLRTVKGGVHAQWKQVKNVVNFVGKTIALRKLSPSKSKEEDEIKRKFSSVTEKILKESSPRKISDANRRGSVTFWMDDRPHSIAKKACGKDQAEVFYQKIEERGITSNVLGKVNYKSKQRHKKSQIDTNFKWNDLSALVYSTLPWSALDTPTLPKLPSYIRPRSTPAPTLTRYAHKVIERKRVLNTFTRRSSTAVEPRRPGSGSKYSDSEFEGQFDSYESSRPSSASSHKKRVNFSNLEVM